MLQRAVLNAAFDLLPRTDGPVLETFPEVIDDRVDEPLACPLPPRSRTGDHPAIDELRSLRPAWDRIDGAQWSDVDFGEDPAALLMDVRAYYEEAALGLSDHVPDARRAESWLYRSTATGLLMRDFLDAVKDADPGFPAVFSIVPMSQTG